MAKDADRPAVDESDDADSDARSAEEAASEPEPDDTGDPEASEPEREVSSDEASASEPAAAADEAQDSESTQDRGTSPPAKAKQKRWTSRLWWALPILMLVEFYAYGHNGRLEVCVGKQGDTDFSLVGQERTDDNRWKFPRCETRLNLGLRSQYDEKVAEATKVACRGATIFRHQGEAKACVASEQGWERRVEGSFVPPWDPAYYEHLFWFLQ